ncbi:MAG: bifunctional phosphoribosylaminoimidazolecarboxamide formyltransferase/IMP cyclohydrolase [Elusimicrobia bacterium]|nr:bifunctional phosphoribosylaminoimidazolecarboxamide formyltransferase/IMP cyclohydrolase [Elusimicrobiota bacterium]MDE2425185.1 bifunctional phosphoribosylaminoimidazolecarboxamide formyltransferase/IMP cyclohydrolase [Elusimicrobiota bacterium]
MKKLAVFASGEGTNLQALIDACAAGRVRGKIVLVVSNNESAGALRRARSAGIETLVRRQEEFAGAEEYNASLAFECQKRGVDLICLAGFMLLLRQPLLKAFPWRILNVHPALLPAFGGKGMYGRRVHEAVLASGARVSGCTIHFVDADYDRGRILAQTAVPVLPGDTPEALAARVRAQEHWAYPKAVALWCDDRVELGDKGVTIRPAPEAGCARLKRALLSVSDKTGLVELARGLRELGVELVSTSGTAKALRQAGLEIRPLESLTGFPEILNGRVKTLHPNIHGAILLRREDPGQAREAELFGIEPIDLVVVNLYPFARTAAEAGDPFSLEVVEQIDIGGVALLRAAAKNFEDVAVLTSPDDYQGTLKELGESQGRLSEGTRRRLALKAFRHTAAYDATISRAWAAAEPAEKFPERLQVELAKVQDLRYGENPHQRAALYAWADAGGPSFAQLNGKELSYNNLLDASGAWDAVNEFEPPAAAVFKHVTPAGLAVGRTQLAAFNAAWACDPLSAFGGVLAFNRPLTAAVAQLLAKRFVEVVVAPGYEPEALQILKQKPRLRLLKRALKPSARLQLRSLDSEVLATEPDRLLLGRQWTVVTKRRPTAEEESALRFAWAACKHVKSNAIVLAGPSATVGIGAGQMSRVDSVHMAGVKYKEYLRAGGQAPTALVLASDAFFPFRDGVDAAAGLGISALVQPGGSIKDQEVFSAADELGLAMVTTGLRHFRH